MAVFEAAEWEHQACLRLEPGHRVRCTAGRLTPQTAPDYVEAEVVSPFVGSEVSAAVIAALPRLRLVATRSTGFDHIDLEACRARGVAVCDVPDYGDPTVAEHAFALLLAVSRHVVEAADRTRRGDFHVEGLRGFDLEGRTLGVVGAGRIGRRVIRIARVFGMTALAADPHPDPAAAAELGFDYVTLDDLLRLADVVSLHAPGGPQTRDLISDAQFAVIKPGCVLINTARGGW
nr:NAD(P)-dependent oxidoreductase [Brevundimonas sp.]